MISTIVTTIDNPLNNPNGIFSQTLKYIDYTMTFAFFIEMVMKVISFGFVFNGKESYLRDHWNVIDFIIVVLCLL